MSPHNSQPTLSFVIPALNEEALIGRTLSSIGDSVPEGLSYEIIVVDDGSQDSTVAISAAHQASVIRSKTKTIAGSRNEGAAAAGGAYLVFLDADVVLTPDWTEGIADVLSQMESAGSTVSGSFCGVSNPPGWIERYWFEPLLENKEPRYIGTGHMIVPAAFFHYIDGFDAELVTGEDYDFCMRAKQNGARILHARELVVEHAGFPKTVSEFFGREAWHGSGDAQSVRALLSSSVSLAAALFLLLHVLALAGVALAFLLGSWVLLLGSVVALAVLLVASVWYKFKLRSPSFFVRQLLLMYVYYSGRAMSLFQIGGRSRRSPRQRSEDEGPVEAPKA